MAFLLNAGVDSVYLSARAEMGEGFAALRSARVRAEAVGEPVPLPEVEGFGFEVLPYGRNSYPVVLRCDQFTVCMTDRKNRPPISVQIGSAFIQAAGVEGAWRSAVRAASAVIGAPVSEVKVSRIDVFADFGDWRLYHADLRGLVRHAKPRTFGEPMAGEFETIQVGKTPLLVRMYRKDIQVREKGGFAHVFWHGYDGPVVRVEVQASTGHLRNYHFGSVEAALASLGDIWRHATSEFVRLHIPGEALRESWPLRPEWALVQQVGFEWFSYSGAVPQVIRAGNRSRLTRLLYGCLTSLGASVGIADLMVVLSILPMEVGSVASWEDFARDVEKKRRKWSRASWRSAIHSATASAGVGEEDPCAPEPLQLDTAPRTST